MPKLGRGCFRDRNTTEASAIGREIGVRYLVRGSVKREGDRLRIIAQLLEAARCLADRQATSHRVDMDAELA